MTELTNLIEQGLAGSQRLEASLETLRSTLAQDETRPAQFKRRCAYMLLNRYSQFQAGKASTWDLLAELRNALMFLREQIALPPALAQQLTQRVGDFHLVLTAEGRLHGSEQLPAWFGQPDDWRRIYHLEEAPADPPAPGDGLLAALSDHLTYRSEAQKLAVYTALTLPAGHTLLAVLPTGSGKSTVSQMLAWASPKPSLTVVVVPTVALGIDQLRATCLLPACRRGELNVRSYYGSVNPTMIRQDIETRKLDLLYISPEALLNGRFRSLISEAARSGYLQHLVIDEAHLVADWGTFFRPEFQYLATLRRELLALSKGALRTHLLSATITPSTTGVLKHLFADQADQWVMIRGDSLRKEPCFCLHADETEAQRQAHVVQLVHLLPRPMIIYTTTLAEAQSCHDWVQQAGFQNVALFTGETPNARRQRVIDQWRNDELSLIVATSAFGLGVDKPHVRSVVHACTPQTPNRYYQECGRGGRDGLPYLCVLCVVPGADLPKAKGFVDRGVMTTDLILKRWQGLVQPGAGEQKGGTTIQLRTDQLLDRRAEASGLDLNWNEYVILFMTRNHMVDIIDVERQVGSDLLKVTVRVRNPALYANAERFVQAVDKAREDERQQARREFEAMARLVSQPTAECWARTFGRIYPLATLNGDGCPACHAHGERCGHLRGAITESVTATVESCTSKPTPGVVRLLHHYRELQIDALLDQLTPERATRLLRILLSAGVRGLISSSPPGQEQWGTTLGTFRGLLLCADDVERLLALNHRPLLDGCWVWRYDDRPAHNDRLYRLRQRFLALGPSRLSIDIAPTTLEIAGQRHLLVDLCNGLCRTVEELLEENS